MFKNRLKRVPFHMIGILLLFLLAAALLYFYNVTGNQAVSVVAAQVYFDGEYQIGDGQWQKITEGEHIPATKGDVVLRGNFHMLAPDGTYLGIFKGKAPIAFYTDHIHLKFREGNGGFYAIDHENPLYGSFACGENWTAHVFSVDGTEPIEIWIHNPHRFGNETAIDEMLSNIAVWGNIDFEREILESGKIQRNIGLMFVIVSFIFLGTALFSTLLHIKNSRIIWMLGLLICFAGGYFVYSAPGVSIWSYSIVSNTMVLGYSMMFYMLFIFGIITYFLHKTKKIGFITTVVLGILNSIYFTIPVLGQIKFYDTWGLWMLTQTVANIVVLGCMIKEVSVSNRSLRFTYAGMGILLIAFEIDGIATAVGTWKGGLISRCVFIVLFVIAIFVLVRIIPDKIQAAAKAKELEVQSKQMKLEKNLMEAELKESRISILLSQIRPHFIYNTLGTIERMCLKDPEKAFELVRNFSLYLRGNFSEIDSVTPICFEEELKHIAHYIHIEKVRFPDINIEYDVETTDFVLPALSVQPLVENAIKHGLMRLETGGTVSIRSRETPTHFIVEVEDDGVGFDTDLPVDEKRHVGLRNIRGRLKEMVDGELLIESKQGSGTKAMIMIPKEGKE